MDLHSQFLEFTQRALTSKSLEREGRRADPHRLLSSLGDSDEIYDLMANTPDDKIGEVLAWVMNVDLPDQY